MWHRLPGLFLEPLSGAGLAVCRQDQLRGGAEWWPFRAQHLSCFSSSPLSVKAWALPHEQIGRHVCS